MDTPLSSPSPRPKSRPRLHGRHWAESSDAGTIRVASDWSDYIHPLAWLDTLRQFRSLGFVLSYLSTILALVAGIVTMLYTFPHRLPVPGPRVVLPESERLYWMAMQLPFLLIPIFGFLAARRDTLRNIMEPMLITRMGPRDVLFGKWIAMNFQILILGCVLLPCVAIRYYKIGANPVIDFVHLVNMMLISSALAACVLPVAFTRRYWDAWAVFVGVLLFWGPFTYAYIHFQETQREISPLPPYWLTVVICFHLTFSIQICLNVGSSQFYEGTLIERFRREKELHDRMESNNIYYPVLTPPSEEPAAVRNCEMRSGPPQQSWFS